MDLQNTQVAHYSILLQDPSGNPLPIPPGDVFTPVSSSGALGVAMGLDANGNQELVATPMVQKSDSTNGGGNITVTVTDSAGDIAASLTDTDAINIVTVPVVNQIHLAAPSFSTQAAPTAPGPNFP